MGSEICIRDSVMREEINRKGEMIRVLRMLNNPGPYGMPERAWAAGGLHLQQMRRAPTGRRPRHRGAGRRLPLRVLHGQHDR